MSTTSTANLGLTKPTPGTNEPFSAGGIVSTNADKIDAAVGKSTTKSTTTTVVSTTAEQVLFTHTLTANTAVAGHAYKLVAFGQAGNVVTAVPTLTLRARLGGVAGQVIGSCVITAPAGAQSGKNWMATAVAICKTTGAGGTWLGALHVVDELGATTVPLSTSEISVLSATVTVDTTADEDFVITAQWSASNASNTVSCHSGYARKEN